MACALQEVPRTCPQSLPHSALLVDGPLHPHKPVWLLLSPIFVLYPFSPMSSTVMWATSAPCSPYRATELRSIPSTPYSSQTTLVCRTLISTPPILSILLNHAQILTTHDMTTLYTNCVSGYPSWKGQVLQPDQLWALYEGLVDNGLTQYSHVLTGTLSGRFASV